MDHYIQVLRHVGDLLIEAQARAVNPALGVAFNQLTQVIEKMKCESCKGSGYLADGQPCPKCAMRATITALHETQHVHA